MKRKLLRWVLKLSADSWQMSTGRVFHSQIALGKKVRLYVPVLHWICTYRVSNLLVLVGSGVIVQYRVPNYLRRRHGLALGIWCCAVTSVFGLHYSITTSGPHVIYAVVFARWRHSARLCDTWFLGSHESTPTGVCITFWRFSCFRTAVHRLSIVFARWHHCALSCKY